MTNALSAEPFADYADSIAGLACSLLKYFGAPIPRGERTLPLADRLLAEKEYQNVILLVLDGMGCNVIRRDLDRGGLFASCLAGEYSSVFPPTTVAALTSLQSGLSPCRHGRLGWTGYFPKEDKSVVLFTNKDAQTGEKIEGRSLADTYFPYRSVCAAIAAAGGNACEISPYISPSPADFASLCSTMRDIMRQKGRKFVFAYWPEPDKSMHEGGVECAKVKKVLQDLQGGAAALFDLLKEDTLLLITADHGMTDAEKNVCLYDEASLASLLKRPPVCEPRALSLFVKEGKGEQFRAAFADAFKESFRLYTREEFLASSLLGEGEPRGDLANFLGDFFAVATGGVSIFLSKEDAARQHGVHAGLTEEELRIPLIALKK